MSVSIVQLLPAQAALSGPGGQLGVVVAGVVVVIAIVAVIFMVVRNNGGAKKVASGIGYDPRQGPLGQPQQDYGDQPPWSRPGAQNGQAGGAAGFGQQGGWQAGGAQGGYGQQAPAPGWGQMPQDPQRAQPGGAWGNNAAPQWGEQAAPAAAPAWGDPAGQQPPQQAWGQPAASGSSALGGWDVPGGPPGPQAGSQPDWAQPWGPSGGGQGAQQWGQQQPAQPGWGQGEPATPGWGQPAAPNAPAAPWANESPGAAPAAFGQAPAQAWNAPQGSAGAAPAAWEAPAQAPSGGNWGGAASVPEAPAQAPWGQPAAPQAPQQPGFGGPQQPGGGFDGNGYAPFGGLLPQAGANKRPGVLLVKQGKEPGRVYEFHNDRLTIGRSRDSDIFLEDLAVSRLHATVYRDSTGQYIVRDENSANGTTVNGMRIGEQALNENDEIALGQTVLVFQRR
jgi:hypothetical protein